MARCAGPTRPGPAGSSCCRAGAQCWLALRAATICARRNRSQHGVALRCAAPCGQHAGRPPPPAGWYNTPNVIGARPDLTCRSACSGDTARIRGWRCPSGRAGSSWMPLCKFRYRRERGSWSAPPTPAHCCRCVAASVRVPASWGPCQPCLACTRSTLACCALLGCYACSSVRHAVLCARATARGSRPEVARALCLSPCPKPPDPARLPCAVLCCAAAGAAVELGY